MQKASRYFSQQVGGQSKYAASSLYYYAHIQYQNGQYESALKNFQQLQSDRKFAKIAPAYIARIYYYLGRDDEFLQAAPALLAQDDALKRDELYRMMGEIYFNRGEYRKALEQYSQVTAEQSAAGNCTPQDIDYQVGYSHYMTGDYAQAARHLERKVSCNDSVAQSALYVLGINIAGSPKLNSHAFAVQIIGACDITVLFNYYHLGGIGIGIGKVYVFQPVLGHSKPCDPYVCLTGLHRRDHRIKTHIFYLEGHTQIIRYGFHDLCVNSNDLGSLIVFIGRKFRVRSHYQNSAFGIFRNLLCFLCGRSRRSRCGRSRTASENRSGHCSGK